ncbi:hypothetical protein FLJC2902T_06850 [Flavobacterium limnosediminis JC2902]|uniref:Uncharacterized protein n=1 Tax=Flavobacterium limnosediminis JC2902 TaxID=1341181 RepID=V6SS67_9FLAO|nr:hypothetical protein FLJC2902T_06850 [Flavobacterium limnosediminis JC2902]
MFPKGKKGCPIAPMGVEILVVWRLLCKLQTTRLKRTAGTWKPKKPVPIAIGTFAPKTN